MCKGRLCTMLISGVLTQPIDWDCNALTRGIRLRDVMMLRRALAEAAARYTALADLILLSTKWPVSCVICVL
jgi:hypothetical protein